MRNKNNRPRRALNILYLVKDLENEQDALLSKENLLECMIDPAFLVDESRRVRLKLMAYLKEYLLHCSVHQKKVYVEYIIDGGVQDEKFMILNGFVQDFVDFSTILEHHELDIDYRGMCKYIKGIIISRADKDFLKRYRDSIEDLKIMQLFVYNLFPSAVLNARYR